MRWRELLVFGEASRHIECGDESSSFKVASLALCAWKLSDPAASVVFKMREKKLFGPANTMKYCITWVHTSMPYMIWYLTR
ncbi:uncharacterized protein PHALS_01596 [Plasmopara halstedii]|uniref:Uncharacterized protein n=1 Tax=Plasmopara halstedii TaxID=4781 RepID=A0A0P1AX39_PLAHL|nr:uncharacterized protein PHALS_01596 [Plasmopara halstedii]CEG45290.1 hypothetical protein PHALS_01596 [Plasmopara halstedii]|eukprot:XP_024581659.1 hypothetical protein PHALS_01596 [Plasmopara halstedii]